MTARISLALLATLLFANSAIASIEYDQNVTSNVIFGSGNANGGFTTDRSNGVELGLRAKVRLPAPMNVFNSNGDGTYNQAAGDFGGGRPSWNYEWSINSDHDGSAGRNLNGLTYALRLDSDPTAGTNFSTIFDPVNGFYFDNSLGNNGTAQGAGTEASFFAFNYPSLVGANNLAQNSWSYTTFLLGVSPFDADADATYTIQLAAFDGTTQLAETSIDVIVGNGGGGGQVPEATALLTWTGLALCGGIFWRRKSQRA